MAAHQVVNELLKLFEGEAISPFGAFRGISAFEGMESPFRAFGGPTGMFNHFHNTNDTEKDQNNLMNFSSQTHS